MSYLTDQLNFNDIHNVIASFYDKARQHQRIGHFFSVIEDFSLHENKIAAFWWMALGGETARLPFEPPAIDMINKHLALGISAQDLDIWLSLFDQTLFEELDEGLAGIWQLRAHEIASHLKALVIEGQPAGLGAGLTIKEPSAKT